MSAVDSVGVCLSSLLGSMFPMPRVLFAMARDGLLFQPLTKVTSKGSPAVATIASGIVAGTDIYIPPYVHVIMIVGLEVMLFSSAAFMALLFDLKALVDMMSIGTLFAYTLVAICILILRYDITHLYMFELQSTCCCKCGDLINYCLASRYQEDPVEDTDFQVKSKFNPLKPPPVATASTSQAVTIMTVISGAWHKHRTRAFMPGFYSYILTPSFLCAEVMSLVGLCVTLTQAIDALARAEAWSIVLVCILGIIVLINTALIYRQPQNSIKATFMVKQNYILKQLWPQFLRKIRLHHFIPSLQMPLVPFLPLLSIFINSYLMVQLGTDTWILYAIWMAVGKTVHCWSRALENFSLRSWTNDHLWSHDPFCLQG